MRVRLTGFLWAVGFAGIGIFAASKAEWGRHPHEQEVSRSPLLQQIQSLGELHTVKYTYNDVHEFSSNQAASPWLAEIPGGESLVSAVTTNTTLMSYTATVEAGIDMTQARVERTPREVKIYLPEPRLYAPVVQAQVHDLHRGLLWRDIRLETDAIEDARLRFRQTSLRQGIMARAKQNARTRLLRLAQAIAPGPVSVTYGHDAV